MRSIGACPPEAVVARAIGHRLMGQAQRGWGEKQWGWRRIAASGQNVDDDRGGEPALIQRLLAGGLDRRDTISGHAAKDRDHLFVAIADALQLAADRGHGGGQNPVTERGAIAKCAGVCVLEQGHSAKDRRSSQTGQNTGDVLRRRRSPSALNRWRPMAHPGE